MTRFSRAVASPTPASGSSQKRIACTQSPSSPASSSTNEHVPVSRASATACASVQHAVPSTALPLLSTDRALSSLRGRCAIDAAHEKPWCAM